MVDFAKKINKFRKDDLHPGEQVEAAVMAQPTGSLGKSVGMQLGGVVGAVASARKDKQRDEDRDGVDEAGIAAMLPTEPAVIGLSGQRLLFFGHSKLSGKPTDLKAAVPLDQVHELTAEKKTLTYSMSVRFADNSAVDFEATKAVKPIQFVEAFEASRAERRVVISDKRD